VRPRYSSQTKEDLITEKKDFGTSFEVTDKMVNKLIKSPVIQSVLDWVTAKEQAALAAEQRKKNKELDKTNLRKITKFTDATEKEKRNECMLFVCEGESASNAILSARTPLIGCYPLKGKPINAMGTDIKKLMENREFVDLLAITGLKIGQKVKDISELRFGKIVSCTDADADGQHIFGLLSALIKKFWPELLEMGVFHKFITPIMKVQIGKTEKLFYSLPEFQKWAEENKDKKFNVRYLKGLGSSTSKDFESYFNNMDKHLVKIVVNDSSDLDIIDLVFGKESGSADKRKEWLQLEDK
jgi:DNA topoisomerase-2